MAKSKNIFKKGLVLFFLLNLCFNSFSAVVSDNDGSAFVTKAEFEALKKDFANQINNYNDSIDYKIDGSIAAYLSGIKVQKKDAVLTGFDLVCGSNKRLWIGYNSTNGFNLGNQLFARDQIYLFANGAYQGGAIKYDHDSYDNWVWEAYRQTGNSTNTLFLLDSNNCVVEKLRNVNLRVNRVYAFYSTTNARDGLTWSNIQITLNKPTSLLSLSSADINSNETYTFAKGYGHGRTSSTTGGTYPVTVNSKVFYENGNYIGTRDSSGNPTGTGGAQCLRSNEETKSRTTLKQQLSVSMTKAVFEPGVHWKYMGSQRIHTTNQDWDTVNMIANEQSSLQNFTITNRMQFESGYWAGWANGVTRTRVVKGYGVKFNENWDATNSRPSKTLNDIYYKELYETWGGDKTSYKYTGGFPMYKAEKDGSLQLQFKSDKAATVRLTKTQNASMPSATATNLVAFDQKRDTTTVWTKNVKTLSMTANANYDISVELNKNDIIYLNFDAGDNAANIYQNGTAYFISE